MVGTNDYFSRFRREDKLCPVITMVLYCDDDWDGNVDLYDMFGLDTKTNNSMIDIIKKYVPNYHINIFNPLNNNDLTMFKTDLQIVFNLLKYKKDKEKLVDYIRNNELFFSSMDYDTGNAVTALLGADKWFKGNINKRKGENNVCKALEDLYNDGVKEGIEQGIEQGIERGIEMVVISLIKKEMLTKEDGAKELGISVDELTSMLT